MAKNSPRGAGLMDVARCCFDTGNWLIKPWCVCITIPICITNIFLCGCLEQSHRKCAECLDSEFYDHYDAPRRRRETDAALAKSNLIVADSTPGKLIKVKDSAAPKPIIVARHDDAAKSLPSSFSSQGPADAINLANRALVLKQRDTAKSAMLVSRTRQGLDARDTHPDILMPPQLGEVKVPVIGGCFTYDPAINTPGGRLFSSVLADTETGEDEAAKPSPLDVIHWVPAARFYASPITTYASLYSVMQPFFLETTSFRNKRGKIAYLLKRLYDVLSDPDLILINPVPPPELSKGEGFDIFLNAFAYHTNPTRFIEAHFLAHYLGTFAESYAHDHCYLIQYKDLVTLKADDRWETVKTRLIKKRLDDIPSTRTVFISHKWEGDNPRLDFLIGELVYMPGLRRDDELFWVDCICVPQQIPFEEKIKYLATIPTIVAKTTVWVSKILLHGHANSVWCTAEIVMSDVIVPQGALASVAKGLTIANPEDVYGLAPSLVSTLMMHNSIGRLFRIGALRDRFLLWLESIVNLTQNEYVDSRACDLGREDFYSSMLAQWWELSVKKSKKTQPLVAEGWEGEKIKENLIHTL